MAPDRPYSVLKKHGPIEAESVAYAFGSFLVFRAQKARPLTPEDRERAVLSDSLIRFIGPKSEGNGDARGGKSKPVEQVLRRVAVWDEKNKQEIVLITDLLDAPAWVIGELYRLRWQVELFFKWLKSWGKLDHLLSQSAAGVTLQLYVAMIGALLLHIATGRRRQLPALLNSQPGTV